MGAKASEKNSIGSALGESARKRITDKAIDKIQETGHELWNTYVDLLSNSETGIDNDGLIVKVFTENKQTLNDFFMTLGEQEFKFIEHCGAAMGFLCGVVQLIAFSN